ncbi:MAG: patatin-like phospholipase family protein [Chloroflexi bacterium]|nr:patatin-like phospholipase family protein [Chloroflexota bacterium]
MKIGLALGGGGVKGVAHIGVLRVLEAEHIPVDVIAGSSAGAIAGALFAAGKTADEIQLLMRQMTFRKWFARDSSGLGLFSTDGMHRLIESAVGEDVNIEDLPRRFVCVAVDLDAQQEVVFSSGPLADAVCASAAYPGLFAPVRNDGRMLFDGGVLNPVPFDVARRYGADCVIAVDLGAHEPFFATLDSAELRLGNPLWQLFYTLSHQKMFRVIERSLEIMLRQIRDQKFKESPPDLIIYPKVREIGLLDFHLVETCMANGEHAARELLPEIQRLANPPQPIPVPKPWQKLSARIRNAIAMRRMRNAAGE